MKSAERMQHLPAFFFADLAVKIAALRAAGKDVIRLDAGSPDLPPAPHILQAHAASTVREDNHGYQPHAGTPDLRQAWADYYQEVFGVTLDVGNELVPVIGSKEGIFNITLAHVDPDDIVLVPNPGYATYGRAARFAGGEVVDMPLLAENSFLPDLASISAEVAQRAKMLWLNYPNNPTTAFASLEFFQAAVDFCREHDVLLCHDAPYAQVTFDNNRAPSVLQVPGAKEVAVEFNSLSKSHNMAGWRVGVAVGNAAAIKALYMLKTNVDSGQFRPILDAATAALTGDQSWLPERNEVYRQRRDVVVNALRDMRIDVPPPRGTMYVWFPIPERWGSMDFGMRLLEEAAISLTPGVVFGTHGEGFARISLGTPAERLTEAMQRIAVWTKANV